MAIRIVTALAAALSSAVLWASPATAHDQLISTDPGDGAIVATMPDAVRLTFSGPPMAIGTTVFVVDAQGRRIGAAQSTIERNVVSLRLPPSAPTNAWYQVRWRIVSGDGHLLSGSFDFGVGDPRSAPKPGLAGSSADRASDAPASSTVMEDRSISRWGVALIGAALAVAIGWLADALLRRRRAKPRTKVPANKGVRHE